MLTGVVRLGNGGRSGPVSGDAVRRPAGTAPGWDRAMD